MRLVIGAARESGVGVVVRSTGHSVAGRCVADGAVVIDMREINGVQADARGVSVGGGATWRQVDAVSAGAGLAVTGGTVSSTGVAGLTLGGGIGWLLPSFGLACDSLFSARVVTSDGCVIEANDEATPDLMWALRGSGAGLGVVTEFRFEPHRLLPMFAGSMTIALDHVTGWLGAISDLLTDPPPGLMAGPSFMFRDGRAVLSLDLVLHGPTVKQRARIESLRRIEGIMRDTVRWRSYVSLQRMIDEPNRSGLRAYWRAGYPTSVKPDFIAALAQQIQCCPSQDSIMFLENLSGAFAHPRFPSSFPSREPRFSTLITGSWRDVADDEVNMNWIESTWSILSPYLSERPPYLNYSSDVRPDLDEHVVRLREVKGQIDPVGLFL